MNVFVVDYDPVEAAKCLMDKHIVKMPLETAQILSTINGGPYKSTHEGHPCVTWAAEAIDNYKWLVKHGLALCDEYSRRYGKLHKCREVIWLLEEPFEKKLNKGSTPFVQCMPDMYRHQDPVVAYRRYYATKAAFAKWTKCEPPAWWLEDI